MIERQYFTLVICLLFYLENKSGGQLETTKNNTLSIIREFWKYLKTQIVAMVGGGREWFDPSTSLL